jgi:hypothetical protein
MILLVVIPNIASIFSVDWYAKQEASRTRVQAVLYLDSEDGGGVFSDT